MVVVGFFPLLDTLKLFFFFAMGWRRWIDISIALQVHKMLLRMIRNERKGMMIVTTG
jgi:hypothetical protein